MSRKFHSKVLNTKFRSTWEVDVAEALNSLGIDFEYEPKRFKFVNERESYLPDFYLSDYDVYIEVKGYMSKRCKRKLRLMRENEPEIVVLVFALNEMKELWKNEKYLIEFVEDGIEKAKRIKQLRKR